MLWIHHNILVWLINSLLPEIEKRNLENLRSIDKILLKFNLFLQEYKFFYQKITHLMETGKSYKNLRGISLSNLLNINFGDSNFNLNWNTENIKSY